MRKLILIFISFITFVPILYSQYKVEWAADFSTSGKFSIDKAQFIITDHEENIIVTGVTNAEGLGDDITTIKYDKSGKTVWTAVYNGPGNFNDRPH